MKRYDKGRVRLKWYEYTIIHSFSLILLVLFLSLISVEPNELQGFIELFVQVNITGALAIAALVASIGTFRWDHYIKGLKGEGMLSSNYRKAYINKNAKNPLYLILFMISAFILLSIVTLIASVFLGASEVSILMVNINIAHVVRWACLSLVAINLALSIIMIQYSLKYMKELLYR
ncbi:hypothetical protein [Paenibacillus sp. MER 99-2]|uniref:hypothetical protein n=1 Tax=Paenibacillus sp. MER 99-2 TaxID=2939572 RepID=UPI002040FEDE|nr:hypothetical protein [Paenibacillus sp. MER 99-2]MCM3172997.1 hypothetical protein [Paenibacillus sp. MER 99-2]